MSIYKKAKQVLEILNVPILTYENKLEILNIAKNAIKESKKEKSKNQEYGGYGGC